MPVSTAQLPSTNMGPHPHTHHLAQPRPPLRRAVYVHVSDLTSAYNIDHARLEEELKRVKADRENNNTTNDPKARIPPPTSTSPIELDGASSTSTQKRLQPPRGGQNLCLLVGSAQVVVDKHRVDGSRVRLAEVEVGDETGTVSLRARDDQIDLLQEISDRKGAVVLRNATLELYQGRHIRLAVTKWGKLSPYPDQVASTPAPPSRMNNDRYFSLIDLSAVASEMAVFPQSDIYTGNTNTGATGANVRSAPTENPSGNVMTNRNTNRQGQGNRRVSGNNPRGKSPASAMGHSPMKQQQQQQQQQPPQTYPEVNQGMLRYPQTLHNYGYAPDVDTHQHQSPNPMYGYHSSRQRQPDAQQIMMQQQYEMQQRHQQAHQMHPQAQIHYQNTSPDRSSQSLGGAMLLSGVANPSFDGRFSAGARGGFPPNPYAAGPPAPTPQPPQTPQQSHHGQPQQQQQQQPNSGMEGIPDSPRMNPQAPTFDPMYNRKSGRK